jgi:PAS domain S-box-containing protein
VIQQQRIAEDRLKQNVDFLQAVMNGTSDAIFVKNLEGRYLLINEPGARMLGKTVAEVQGRDDFYLFDEATANRLREEDQQTLDAGQMRTYESPATRTGTHDPRFYHVTKGPYRDALGRLVGVVGIAIDITERRIAQQQLERAKTELERRVSARTAELLAANQRLRLEMSERSRAEERLREQQTQLAHAARLSSLGQMAAEMAHELNQPLSAISNYVRGTQRRVQAGGLALEDVLSTLDIIGKEANRAADVIRRTKNFVRQQSPSRTPLDLGAVAHEAIKLVQHELRDRQIKLELQIGESLPRCAGDFVQLQQVIVNLVLNAADALESLPADARRVVVAVRSQGDSLELSIADTGPGLSAPVAERIFDAFFSTKPEGLGLGLPISRGIIESHGGRLWAERVPEGGTCLRFTIPVWEGMDDNLNGA